MGTPSTSTASSSGIIPDDSPIDERDMPATERAIAELFEGIDAIYFMENGFKAISYELEKLAHSPVLEIDELERERFKLKREMKVVTKKISALIVKNSLGFNQQVENYEHLRIKADQLLRTTRELRSSIEFGKRKCTSMALTLASNYKKRVSFALKRELAVIATFQNSEYKIRQLIQEGDMGFLQLIVEAIKAITQYNKYSSIKQISVKFTDLLKSMESRIDEILAMQTKLFVFEWYNLLNSAYRHLGNFELVSVKLLNFFRATLCEVSCTALRDLLKGSSKLETTDLDLIPYEKLCQFIGPKNITRSLCEVGSALVDVLHNYHHMLKFHINEDKIYLQILLEQNGTDSSERQEDDDQLTIIDAQDIVEKGIMQKSLIDNVFSVFTCACEIYNTLLKSLDLTALKFDQLLKVIDISERFRKFGHQHFGEPCEEIERSIETHCRLYLIRYHLEKMDELKMFLESETFTLCPVSVQFTLFDLPEFFIKEAENDGTEQHNGKAKERIASPKVALDLYDMERQISFKLIEQRLEEIFPRLPEQHEESPNHKADKRPRSIINSSRNSSSCDTFEETTDEIIPNSMPNLCNSSLNMLRIIGKYIQMSNLLGSTAEFTIDAIIELFHYYVFSIYTFFCTDSNAEQQQQLFGTNFVSLRLRQFVQSASGSLKGNEPKERKQTESGEECSSVNVNVPTLCHTLFNNNEPDKLFMLAERIVGIESAIFLMKQMELLRPFLDSLLPKRERNANLEIFYKTLPAVFDLSEAAFGCVAAKALPYPAISKQILSTDWELCEIQQHHSSYVDVIVKGYTEFRHQLGQLYAYVHISNELHASIWSVMLHCTVRILVQGYSEAKKCSTEGRALQLLDVEQLCRELEELTELRPLPHKPFVENYIKAFYLPTEVLNEWIVHHTEYNLNQTSALLNAALNPGSNTRKATVSRIVMNLLDASGICEGNNPLFQ